MMSGRVFRSLFGGTALLVGAPAFGADFYEERGGWAIANIETGCGMTMEYEGPGASTLVLLKRTDGELFMQVTNANWTSKEGQNYDVSFVLNGTSFSGAGAIGSKNSYRNGFMASFEAGFEQAFARGSTLHIYLGEQRIDQLSLAGTGVALAAVNRCLVGVRARLAAEAREKARWEHLPKDPFVGGTALSQNSPNLSPVPRGNLGTWATTNDYPSAALREEREGVVRFSVEVSSDGRVTGCKVTQSSGSADLDDATCSNVTRRARFNPATGPNGQPTNGAYAGLIRWTVPKD